MLDQLVGARVPELQGMVSTACCDCSTVHVEGNFVDNTALSHREKEEKRGKERTRCDRNSCASIDETRHSKA
jgi:hypothetical protein